jgi:hypothetical protein
MAGALREIAASFGITWEGSALERGVQSVEKAKGSLLVLGGFLASTAYALTRFATGFENDAGRLQDTANSLGLTTTQLQELQGAAVRAGLRTEQFGAAMQRFQQSAEAAAQGTGAQAEAFHKLGIKVKDGHGGIRSTNDLMDDLAVAFDKVEDPARRAAMAHDLFGRSGSRLATILHTGQGGLAELRHELAALGGGLTQDGVEAADKFGDELDRLKISFDSTRSAIAVVLLPPLTWLVDKVKAGIVWFSKLAKETSIVQTMLVGLGVAAAIAGASMLAAFLPVILAMAPFAAAFALVYLVIDDLITMFRGGDSVSGRLIDAIFGKNASKDLVEFFSSVENIKGFIYGLAAEFDNLANRAGQSIMHVLDMAANWIDEKIKSIQRAVNKVATGLGFKEVFDMSTTQGTRGLSGTIVTEDQRLGRAQGTATGAVTNRMSRLERDIFSLGQNPLITALPSRNTATVPIRDFTRGLGAPATTIMVDAPITINNPNPEEAGRQAARHIQTVHADQLARAHAARRDLAPSGDT